MPSSYSVSTWSDAALVAQRDVRPVEFGAHGIERLADLAFIRIAGIHDLARQPVRGKQQLDTRWIGIGKLFQLGAQHLYDRALIIRLVVPLAHQRDGRLIVLPLALALKLVIGAAARGHGILRV